MKHFAIFVLPFALAACNSMYIKPNTLDVNDVIYVDRGGYQLQHFIKERLEQRGYNVTVGYKKSSVKTTYIESDDSESILSVSDTGHARYVVQISERKPVFNPFWCPFNGLWWWRFNMSIADNKTGQEILGWTGRGCQNSSLRKLNAALDELEMTEQPVIAE